MGQKIIVYITQLQTGNSGSGFWKILPPDRFNNLEGFLSKNRLLSVSVRIATTAPCAFYMAYNPRGLQFGT